MAPLKHGTNQRVPFLYAMQKECDGAQQIQNLQIGKG